MSSGDETRLVVASGTSGDAARDDGATSTPPAAVLPDEVEVRASARSNVTVTVSHDESERMGHGALASAQAELDAFEGFSITVRAATLADAMAEILSALREGATRAARVVEAFEQLVSRHGPAITIDALVGQGRAYDVLANAILRVEVPVGGAPPAVGDRIRAALDPGMRVIECRAIRDYALAARAARLLPLDDESTRLAIARLAAFGAPRVAECIDLMRRGDRARGVAPDPRLTSYQPGEFDRAPAGATLPLEPGRAAPPLAGE